MTTSWVVAAALAGALLRLGLGEAAAVAPFAAAAWTVFLARRAVRGRFVVCALVAGLLEGPSFDAPWCAVPLACLAIGCVARATRRVLPARRPRGEALVGGVFGAMAAALLRAAAPGDAPPLDGGGLLMFSAGAAATGLVAGLISRAAERTPALRAALLRR